MTQMQYDMIVSQNHNFLRNFTNKNLLSKMFLFYQFVMTMRNQ
ncbi:hypothetical protein DYY66_1623 [Candidatus Nitrosotalea sp. FS]|nr:hypothetical protein [Candidatus Nitrosotalea sp. FS]